MPPCFFIFGFGYTAEYLTHKLRALNFRVIGTTRDQEKIARGYTDGCTLIDFCDPNIADYLRAATHILVCIPPAEPFKDPVLDHFGALISQYRTNIQWLGYLSSTGVYGDHQGAWINESSAPCAPGKRGLARLEAEKAWNSFAKTQQLPLHIFRLAGIYGPGRNALERILAGKKHSIYKEGQYFSRIHVLDIASILLASIKYPNPFSIYNVADDEPAPAHNVDAYACTLLKRPSLPLIPYDEAALSAMEHEFYANNRRVSNNKIKEELLIKLEYPSYREGLTGCYALT